MKRDNPGISKWLIVLSLLFIFSAPILLAWWMLNYTNYGRDGAAASHGHLIAPPRALPDTILVRLNDPSSRHHLHGKWNLVYLQQGDCGKNCIENLYKMRQIRLATGEFAPRIQRVIVFTDAGDPAVDHKQISRFEGQLMLRADGGRHAAFLAAFRLADNENPVEKHRLYLVDPLGNLMMSYSPATNPVGIIKDLRRLLRYSRIG